MNIIHVVLMQAEVTPSESTPLPPVHSRLSLFELRGRDRTPHHHRDRTMPHELENVDLIDLYSRQEAIADGQQIQITERYSGYTRRFRFGWPILMTRSVWNDLMEELDEADRKQAIWLILAGLSSSAIANTSGNGDTIHFTVSRRSALKDTEFWEQPHYHLIARCGSRPSNPLSSTLMQPKKSINSSISKPSFIVASPPTNGTTSATPSSKKYIHR